METKKKIEKRAKVILKCEKADREREFQSWIRRIVQEGEDKPP